MHVQRSAERIYLFDCEPARRRLGAGLTEEYGARERHVLSCAGIEVVPARILISDAANLPSALFGFPPGRLRRLSCPGVRECHPSVSPHLRQSPDE